MVSALKFEKNNTEDFWALKDVSFEVQPGESIGIIGRNGVGKSTLLKILSKITPPTTGRIVSRGRIASLLEVGTGFHPELTGRENIFFNGSLLGMKRKEIAAKFDEIVDFSGVEKFLDTPLKHYSSGMQLRLAFAVAAFLEPEVLIIDEVLAVGDAEFQKKCLGKMEDVSRSGRTILFVSHNMGMVSNLCNKSIWINNGIIKLMSDTDKVISGYLQQEIKFETNSNSISLGEGVIMESIDIVGSNRSLTDWQISFQLSSEKDISINSIGLYINSLFQDRIGIIDLRSKEYKIRSGELLKMNVRLNKIPLIEGNYKLGLFLGSDLLSGNFDNLLGFQVVGVDRSSNVLEYPLQVRGKVEFDYDFDYSKI